jgi:hypothetical protein
MSLRFSRRMSQARAIAVVCLGLLALGVVASAQQVSGRVINRSGTPQAGCQVEFTLDGSKVPAYRVTTNNTGYFYLNNPAKGTYAVLVRQGQQRFSITVTIDAYGLHPSSLLATW